RRATVSQAARRIRTHRRDRATWVDMMRPERAEYFFLRFSRDRVRRADRDCDLNGGLAARASAAMWPGGAVNIWNSFSPASLAAWSVARLIYPRFSRA